MLESHEYKIFRTKIGDTSLPLLFTFFLILLQVGELTQQFPAALPLALIMKKFLADRSLDHPYSGGLSSYCLVCSFS